MHLFNTQTLMPSVTWHLNRKICPATMTTEVISVVCQRHASWALSTSARRKQAICDVLVMSKRTVYIKAGTSVGLISGPGKIIE